MANLYRAWINQPSTRQELHYLHGKRGIVNDDGNITVQIFFTEGPVHSMQIPRSTVSRAIG